MMGESSGTGRPATSTIPVMRMSSSSCKARPKAPSRCPFGRCKAALERKLVAFSTPNRHPLRRKMLQWRPSPMAKSTTRYVWQSCGASFSRWMGKCESCNAWNSIVEEAGREEMPKGLSRGKGKNIEFVALDGQAPEAMRRPTGNAEFDRVTGGGLVRGSAILIGGDPGIGKSTLLLQIVTAVAGSAKPLRSAYISGEEAVEQVQLRARRVCQALP